MEKKNNDKGENSLRPCLHDTGSPSYRIPFHIGLGLCLYGSAWIRYALLQHSNTTLLGSASAGDIQYNPYRFVSHINIVIRYETLPNLPLIIGWLQCKWGWSIAWQIRKQTTNMADVMKLFSHEIVSLGHFQASCKHSYSGAFCVPDSRKRSGMKSNPISCKPGLGLPG